LKKLLKFSLVALPALLLALSGCNSSQAVSPTTLLDTAPPAAPSGLGVALDGSGKRVLEWSANSEADLATYQVYQSTSGAGNGYALVGTLPAGTTDWSLPAVSAVVPAWFKVSAVDLTGNASAQSSALGVTLLPPVNGETPPVDEANPIRH
jgi:hypothetical protein